MRRGSCPYYLPRVLRPRVTPKLTNIVLSRATGDTSDTRALILRGTVVHPRMIDNYGNDVWLNSHACGDDRAGQRVSSSELATLCDANISALAPTTKEPFLVREEFHRDRPLAFSGGGGD